ncbi:MAG: prolipoprotein diacylglyceryl transferase [Gammaproteobacteria bacterium]|nr:prolipoprotein diacylglyceryl transferase [Gammaproteobacteria bacterium]MCH9744013.1 prolipoprotein diacylglyceryl transferase [Gammaproteobacteria bacterium]
MLQYPHFDPVAFKIGPIKVHWYGLMYLVGFIGAYLLGVYRAKHSRGKWNSEQVADIIFYAAIGVIVGGRIGYMLFYNFPTLIHQPWVTFYVWDGGMSFHGGMIGAIIALLLLTRKFQKSLIEITDFVAPLVPIGLAAGRLGNFINGELWGRVTTVPWAMVFPNAGPLPRHPSQLYEFFLEGVVLFIILWWFSSKPRPRFAVSAMFLLCYGCFRFFLEFFRNPDPQLGFIVGNSLTMGQILSIPMIIVGIIGVFWVYCQGSNN